MYRTHSNGELRMAHVGQNVTLAGWVQKSRDKGFMIWVDWWKKQKCLAGNL
jgi:aspartyl-tRNA synthetase